MMLQGMQKAKEAFPEEFGKLDEAKFGKLMDIVYMQKLNDSYKEWMPDVLVHGDFWANNVMFNKLPDGSMGDQVVSVIDWQLPMVGNPMIDLGRVFSMCANTDMLEEQLEKVIRHYYNSLEKKLGNRMPKEYTFERAFELAQEYTAFSCLMMLLMHDAMDAIFATDGPEGEARKQRMLHKAKGGIAYASTILDISSGSSGRELSQVRGLKQ